jgi:ABC-type bacteriocin/lantibiotic exporter with double-glycine peptidase domain
MFQKAQSSVVVRASKVIPKKSRRKLYLVIAIQISLGILDLVGVAAIGVLGALAITGVQSGQPGTRVTTVLEILNIADSTLQVQATVLGVSAAVLLMTRTLLSVLITRRIMHFLSRRGAELSSILIHDLLSKSILEINSRTIQQTIYLVTTGVNTMMLGVIGATIALISDLTLLAVMSIGLFVVDPLISLTSTIVFIAIGFAMYKFLHKKARLLGDQEAALSISSNEKISEILLTYRESLVRNRRIFYANEIKKRRFSLADVVAEQAFMPNISKYVIEGTIVFGALAIGATQFILQDAPHAIATLSVFLAAGSRIAPAILRVQQGSLQVKGSLGAVLPTLELLEKSVLESSTEFVSDKPIFIHSTFDGKVEMESVDFSYPESSSKVISDVSFSIDSGEFVAIVGSSGAGKTTLADLIIGVLSPDSGSVKVSGFDPQISISKWSGALAYVPQEVTIVNGTILENVALGYDTADLDLTYIWDALDRAQLGDVVRSMPNGLSSFVGERGTKLSGGQRQRLGIARALFTRPRLIIFDEATSALDGQTEHEISTSLSTLKGEVTLIVIAHRLSTVQSADKVIYLEGGRLRALGTFNQVREAVPNFDHQAKLMGL